ncbi:MAG: glycosyltransferase [Dysgonamonadaceae bacterium]|jgi:GT2 family glycosyltransferase|nr:glycosyltransferase [Dysgonamonadaceae bacterium]
MLSICIPIYNYDVSLLVRDLHLQAGKTGRPFEILLMDDASDEAFEKKNRALALDNVRYIQLDKNIGRAKIRNRLAGEARYPYLLFMDCDSAVSSDLYIENYIPHCEPQIVCYGGRKYADKKPDDATYLRWKYGVERECFPAAERRKNPDLGFCTNNFLIHRPLFEKVKFDESLDGYGHEDTFFGLELQAKCIHIRHIDNPLIHIGLESAAIFIEKTENGIINLQRMEKLLAVQYPEHLGHSRLTRTKLRLQKLHLIKPAAWLFKLARKAMKKHLSGKNPSLRIFDLYKLGLLVTSSQ